MASKKNSITEFIILFIGIAVIVAGFFILIPKEKWNDIFWLNLFVVNVLFIGLYCTIFELGFIKDIKKDIAGIGVRWFFVCIYCIATVTMIICGLSFNIAFEKQLYFQIVCFFILIIAYSLASISSKHAEAFDIEEKGLREGKDKITDIIDKIELIFAKEVSKWNSEKRQIGIVKESVRYLSPTNNPEAKGIESEIISEIEKIIPLTEDANPDRQKILDVFTKCNSLIGLRKKMYSN